MRIIGLDLGSKTLGVSVSDNIPMIASGVTTIRFSENNSKEALEQVEINHKYDGYISKAKKEAEKMIKLGKKQIPDDIDYQKVDNLATEARQKLEKVRPRTIDQATRISGVNPSDIAILMVYLKRYYNE